MKITQLISYTLIGTFSVIACFPSESMAMWKKTTTTEEWGVGAPSHPVQHKRSPKELIESTYRIQLFSHAKSQGKHAAHGYLETMRSQAPTIANYPSLIAIEKGSNWIRGQISMPSHDASMPSHDAAADMQTKLRKIFTKDQPTVSAPGVIHQSGFALEEAEEHIWR